jgi:hypothetical protein
MIPPEGFFGWMLVDLRSGLAGAAPVMEDEDDEQNY